MDRGENDLGIERRAGRKCNLASQQKQKHTTHLHLLVDFTAK